MNWSHLNIYRHRELKSENMILEFEEMMKYTLPEDFKDFVRHHNGARLINDAFDVNIEAIGTTDFSPLSFNKGDPENIWNFCEWYNEDEQDFVGKYLEFGMTSAGDHICFDMTNNHIVLIDHETLEIAEVADTFTEFSHMLYED